MSMTTPPGWYPDPHAPGAERWWDGSAWTAHTRAVQGRMPPGDGSGPHAAGGGFGRPTPAGGPGAHAPAGGSGPFAPGGGYGPHTPAGGFGTHTPEGGFGTHTPAGGPGPHAAGGGFGPPTVPLRQSSGVPAGRGGRGRRAAALSAAAVVVAAAVVTGAVLLGTDDDPAGPETAPESPVVSASATTGAPGPSPEKSAEAHPGRLVDQLNGISLPIPDGWIESERALGSGATMYTDATYECPGGGSPLCRHGQVTSITADLSGATGGAATARSVAEKDIGKAADASYDEDALGNRTHGGITSHSVVKAQNVAVAGRAGYLVRWKVVTGAGPGGYVQSLVFPSTAGTGALVVVRFAFDAGPDGPDLAEMDRITAGIRAIGDDTASGGVGSSIGPGPG